GNRKIRLNRIHMEEDAGKSLHDETSGFTSLDYNRAGMPLLEIVTEPDIRTAEEAYVFVSSLRKLVRHLDVCDGNMEQGSFRCDVNISVREKGDKKLGTRVEVKNLNSVRFIKKAIEFESRRLINLHQAGATILQETRGFDETDFSTYSIRTKEDEDDYRYFPEPDLPPFYISDASIASIRAEMPPLQEETRSLLMKDYQLSADDASIISEDMELTSFYLELVAVTTNYKSAANWITGPVKQYLMLEEMSLKSTGIGVSAIAQMIELIDSGIISYGIASQKIFPELILQPGLDIEWYIKENGLQLQTGGNEMDEWIEQALKKHAQKIPEYKKGKKGLVSVFVGEVMKASKGRVDARIVTDKIIEKLNER
ncbi:MAG: Asp-tRNA(Asn)/Glu-tRNA(Gln) amidotransferase subunit GatB, partial [Flavisolibacter sp.]